MKRTVPKKVPPDGGYGWVVTFAYALNNVSNKKYFITLTNQLGLNYLLTYLVLALIAYVTRHKYLMCHLIIGS